VRFDPLGRRVAFSVDLEHRGIYALFVWDAADQSVREIHLDDVHDMEWDAAGCTLFFTERENGRVSGARRWSCLTGALTRLMHLPDQRESLLLRRGKAGDELLLLVRGSRGTHFYSIETADPGAAPRLRFSSTFSGQTLAQAHPSALFVLERGGRLLRVPRSEPSKAEIVELPPDVLVDDLDVYRETVVLFGRSQGKARLLLYRIAADAIETVQLPEGATRAWRLPVQDFDASSLRVGWESLVTPQSEIEVALRDGAVRTVQKPRYPPPFDEGDFVTRIEYASSSDGTPIPCTIALMRETPLPAPVLLQGYGALESEELRPLYALLMKRGFVIAIAHVRGGGYGGAAWHDAGRGLHKLNSFEDFISCARALQERGIAAPGKIYAYGKSAGGLLVAASAARDPTLFAGIILDRPFVDVIAGLEGADSIAAAQERAEWGDPSDAQVRRFLESYSPVEQVAVYEYPALLTITSFQDRVVPALHVLRWFALLRARDSLRMPTHERLLFVSTTGTHDGESDALAQSQLDATVAGFVLSLNQDSR
jgi:oligopeptidase B